MPDTTYKPPREGCVHMTIRNVPKELARALRIEAAETGTTQERVILAILEQHYAGKGSK